MRSQLRLALAVLLVAGRRRSALLPLLFRPSPASPTSTCSVCRCPWVLLTVVAFTEIIALGWFYVRQSERNEDDFSDLLDGR